jgi:adenylate kinase family enzyme
MERRGRAAGSCRSDERIVSRIHVFGASGSGTTTLGRALGARLAIPLFDADDYFWEKTDPPFKTPNPPDVRVRLLAADLDGRDRWILSGSVVGWGNVFAPSFTLAVFLSVPHELRMQRIVARERDRYGARIDPGGDMVEQSREFIAWASRYETAGYEQRSRVVHEAWINTLTVPLLRIDDDASIDAWCERVCAALG